MPEAHNADDLAFLGARFTPNAERRHLRAIAAELFTCSEELSQFGPCVAVFASSRVGHGHRHEAMAIDLGRRLAMAGCTVVTGGGPGLMEATNRAARAAGGASVGLRVEGLHLSGANDHLDKVFAFKHMLVRNVVLLRHAKAFIALPGGFGTLEEVFRIACLIQVRRLVTSPLVLVGTTFWDPLLRALRHTMLADGALSESDLAIMQVVDSPCTAVNIVVRSLHHQESTGTR